MSERLEGLSVGRWVLGTGNWENERFEKFESLRVQFRPKEGVYNDGESTADGLLIPDVDSTNR
jgi:hypothetical protein